MRAVTFQLRQFCPCVDIVSDVFDNTEYCTLMFVFLTCFFAELYDAQIANITLIHQPNSRGTYYAQFTEDSRFGIFANGPHNPGIPISFALWIKYNQSALETSKEMLLVHYGNNFGYVVGSKKDIFTLTLKNGTPALYRSPTSVLVPEDSFTLGDNEWHHIVVSMPKPNCKLSEVVIYIDGTSVRTKQPKFDKHIFFITSGRMSIGGFGYSSDSFESVYPNFSSYVGSIDDFSMWSRPIEQNDFLTKIHNPTDVLTPSPTRKSTEKPIGAPTPSPTRKPTEKATGAPSQ